MKRRTGTKCSRSCPRGAFTLVEIMVVITIIAALVALTAGAVLKFVGVQQNSNTQSSLNRLQSQLAKSWSAVKDQAVKDPLPPGSPVYSWIQTNLGGLPTDPNLAERVRVIYVKLKLRQAFPMSFTEALTPPTVGTNVCPLPPLPAYQTYLGKMGISGSSAQTAAIESSACLLMALQRGTGGGGIDPSQLTAGGAAGSYDLGLVHIPYLTDAWSRPIFFTRAPAGNLYLNPANATSTVNAYPLLPWSQQTGIPVTCYSQPGNTDPGDPQGLLNTGGWGATYGVAFFSVTGQVIANPNALGQPTTYKLAPLVASGGPSDWTKPGQFLPFDPITFFTVQGSDSIFSTP